MREYEVGAFGRVRVWLGSLPACRTATARQLTATIETTAAATPDGMVAVEVLVPRGGRSEYALLGGTWAGKEGDVAMLVVDVDGRDGPPLRDNLASAVDEVHVGLPEEYSDAIFSTLKDEAGSLGGGTLHVTHAAHGLVGSSNAIFIRVAKLLPELLKVREHGEKVTSLVSRLW